MPRIKFIRDYRTQTNPPETFRAGQTVERSPESCQHFINRGAAELEEGEDLSFEPGQFSPSQASVGPRNVPEEQVLQRDHNRAQQEQAASQQRAPLTAPQPQTEQKPAEQQAQQRKK